MAWKTIVVSMVAVAVAFLTVGFAQAIEIQEVTGEKSAVKAWLVEDYSVPIITVAVSFEGGSAQDPDGKEGLAGLLGSLFDEGAGPYDSKAFNARLEKLGVSLGFRESRDTFDAVLRTLRSDRSEAFDMMRLALTELRFDEDAITRMRDAMKARIIRGQNNPRTKVSLALRSKMFGQHPYARGANGTLAGLDAVTRDDLLTQFNHVIAREKLTVGIVGAISADEAADMLDNVFGGLPQKATLTPIEGAQMRFGDRVDINENTPQTVITLALPGVARNSPEFFAAYLMNHILGGGTFSSRLYDEVREKRGLAYSISSNLANYDRAAFLTVGSAIRPDKLDETLSLIRGEIEQMAKEGPTEQELEAAKKYVIGSYAINNLDTSSKVARALVALQTADLGMDYIERRSEIIGSVTLDDVKSIARKLLTGEPTVVIMGPQNS